MEALQTAAHTLKSSSATLGALGLAQLCKQLETLVRHSPELDIESVEALLPQLQAEYHRVMKAVDALFTEYRPKPLVEQLSPAKAEPLE